MNNIHEVYNVHGGEFWNTSAWWNRDFSSVLWGTHSELVWVCSSASANCWWARSACWETKASCSLILDSSLWRGRTPIKTHTHRYKHIPHNDCYYFFISCIYYHSIKAQSSFIHQDQQPDIWPTYVLSCWMDALMRWISSASRRFRARCANASVCRAFRQRGIRSSIDW